MSLKVPGFKGIMELDLTNVDKRLHSEMKRQHEIDIEEYKVEQEKLPEKLRYENTVVRAEKVIEMDAQIMKRKKEIFLEKQRIEDENRYKRFIDSQLNQ
jgi:hypothetical protein|tara:strand:+ start:231 stop:527 length:297 start_codon:yes stop_codon:yes gene_type:complete